MKTLTRIAGALALGAGLLVAPTAAGAAPEGDDLVIAEAYLNGGSAGAAFSHKFVEIANPTDEAISVAGWSVQYRSATSSNAFSGVIPLGDHTIPAGGRLLVGGNSNGTAGASLPEPDVTSGIAFSGSAGGTLALARTTQPLSGDRDGVLSHPQLVDLLGYGSSSTYEGAGQAAGYSRTTALTRDDALTDTDDNRADFTAASPTPEACGVACDGGETPEPEEPEVVDIADIQGTGDESPLLNHRVTTRGVVTAAYPTGGFNGIYLQTPGSGGDVDLEVHEASQGVFVYSAELARSVHEGDHLELTGRVGEYYGLTQIVPDAGAWTVLDEPVAAVKPAVVEFPLSEAERESLEGMLLAPANDFTVTNNYTTHQYGEIGLAAGEEPLRQPTDVARPRTPEYDAVVAENASRAVTVDDAATINFLNGANREIPVPWLTPENEVRVGAAVQIEEPMILDFRNDTWKLQPTAHVQAGDAEPLRIEDDTRPERPADVGGDVRLATFNVLNYFTTVGEDYEANGLGSCTYYTDRAGDPITVNRCSNEGPRGAADAENLQRQQDKIVAAISQLGADVVSLEEIENSAAFGIDRDTALRALVAALNEHAGREEWAAVASPAAVPEAEDVIRTAFIYRPDAVAPVGESVILDDPAFDNARDPLSQEFRPVGSGEQDDFLVIVNHFKSKGSGEGEDADQGDGQGASNASRVRQAAALVAFAQSEQDRADTDRVFLTGDFNAYSQEDPVQVFAEAGYVNVPAQFTDAPTYQFDGQMGSLDHVFASPSAFEQVTGSDIWAINAEESIAREYSRYNQNVTQLYDRTPYRASDHNPAIIGIAAEEAEPQLDLRGTAEPVRWPRGPKIDVSAHPEASGTVIVRAGWIPLGIGRLHHGEARASVLPLVLGPGTHRLSLSYVGDGQFPATTVPVDVTVTRR
ncbi:ExeM/NucH family extracellular endonuclease [Aeromicrobium camelliae]|uniref:ExeM/NucH family extracellular endonuclease n=2 Tax=Aeromicrobium TaxID=2040 RepID=A0A3N6ZBV2_9ACTN|nr:ExeM/NucH family extracellular endonuclease [Aeromicrobium camelliae]RQN07671.1 ExeM/NucH family extracellular endonuclease [Aeromicrobium camelliae]